MLPWQRIISCRASPAAVEAIALGDDGVRDGLTEGAIVVDCSTSPPALARHIAEGLDALGIASLDAPVSGGPVGAEAGTLTVMVGGSAAAFARVGGAPRLARASSTSAIAEPGRRRSSPTTFSRART